MPQKLHPDWFIEGRLDFEYKKYVLLAWLKHVSQEFAQVRLYPSFADLIFHYRNLADYQANKERLRSEFPRQISEEAFRQLLLDAQPKIEEGTDLQEIDAIVEYALPNLKNHLRDGKEVYEHIDTHLRIEPIGIMPLYKQEGYVFLRIESLRDIKVFEYKVVFFENVEANYHGISFRYLHDYRPSLAHTYEAEKRKLIRHFPKLPNPATYLLYSPEVFPEEATLLPVAKRKMLSYLKTKS